MRPGPGAGVGAGTAGAAGVGTSSAPVHPGVRGHAASPGSCRRIAPCRSVSSVPGRSPSSASSLASWTRNCSSASDEPRRSVQSEHAQPAGAVAERELAAQFGGVDEGGCEATQGEQRGDPGLAAFGAHLVEGCRRDLHPVFVAQVLEEMSPHRVEGTVGGVECELPFAVLGVPTGGLGVVEEAGQVDRLGRDVEDVTGRLAHDRGGRTALPSQHPAQIGDVRLDARHRAGGHVVLPQGVDQPVGGDHPPPVEQQDGEDRSLLPRTEIDLRLRGAPRRITRRRDPNHLQRSEQSVHHVVSPLDPGRTTRSLQCKDSFRRVRRDFSSRHGREFDRVPLGVPERRCDLRPGAQARRTHHGSEGRDDRPTTRRRGPRWPGRGCRRRSPTAVNSHPRRGRRRSTAVRC